jgi:AhpD family alkylhydroperoxidase
MDRAHDVLTGLREPSAGLRKNIPGVYDAFIATEKAALADGALPARVKQLIALAVAATRQCDGCISSHARGAAREGATEAEVAEAMGVVIMLNGGPGTVWGPRAFAAYGEFASPETE